MSSNHRIGMRDRMRDCDGPRWPPSLYAPLARASEHHDPQPEVLSWLSASVRAKKPSFEPLEAP